MTHTYTSPAEDFTKSYSIQVHQHYNIKDHKMIYDTLVDVSGYRNKVKIAEGLFDSSSYKDRFVLDNLSSNEKYIIVKMMLRKFNPADIHHHLFCSRVILKSASYKLTLDYQKILEARNKTSDLRSRFNLRIPWEPSLSTLNLIESILQFSISSKKIKY